MSGGFQFYDRSSAGKQLAFSLQKYRDEDVVIFALPRGGVVVAYEIAQYLHKALDLIITRKIAHPNEPEYAIGAVAENGHQIFNRVNAHHHENIWLREQVALERQEAKRRRLVYLDNRHPLSAKNKVAILVDDGVATGLTLRVALIELKHQLPSKIIVAVPVIPNEIAQQIKYDVDEIVALNIPQHNFTSVGAYYTRFPQVTDAEVMQLMEQSTLI